MQALEEKLQYHFKNPALLEEALRHSSYANEHRGANFFSNERLEFLGDSVLGFVTAEYLFAKHPTAPEGELTRIRALLVCEDSLHEVAQRLERLPAKLFLFTEFDCHIFRLYLMMRNISVQK